MRENILSESGVRQVFSEWLFPSSLLVLWCFRLSDLVSADIRAYRKAEKIMANSLESVMNSLVYLLYHISVSLSIHQSMVLFDAFQRELKHVSL